MGLPRKGPLSAAACFGWVARGHVRRTLPPCRLPQLLAMRHARRTFCHVYPAARSRAEVRGEMSDATVFARWLSVCDVRRQPIAFYANLSRT